MSAFATRLRRVIRFVVMLIAAVSFFLPAMLTFLNSFMTEDEISANYGVIYGDDVAGDAGVNLKLIPDMVTGEQYETLLLKSPDYLVRFWNSVVLAVPVAVLQVFVALLAAYGLARLNGLFKTVVFFVYMLLMLMPWQVTLVPNYIMADRLGMLGSRWAVILPGIFAPFSVYLLTKYIRRIPVALFEAAKIDGVGEWRIFLHIALPLLKGPLASAAILVFLDYWNMVEQPLMLLKEEAYRPLSVFLARINRGETGLAFAAAVIYMIPPVLIFLYGEEYLSDGIAHSGGVKG